MVARLGTGGGAVRTGGIAVGTRVGDGGGTGRLGGERRRRAIICPQ